MATNSAGKQPRARRIGWHALVFICALALTLFVIFLAPEDAPLGARKIQRRRTVSDFSLSSLDRLGSKMAAHQDLTKRCNARPFGSGYGEHTLCTIPTPKEPCAFYSFGISNDYSFDVDFANTTGCIGIAADPTVTHSSKLHPLVYYVEMAAITYDAEDTSQFPLRTSVPALQKFLGHAHLAVLKMDCEGCEYSLARDILSIDPTFLHNVDQFAVEIHYSKKWLKSLVHLHALAALVELLEDAGMDLVHFGIGGCAPSDQATGLVHELERVKLIDIIRQNGREYHCHNYLFAKV
jgi:hypothetical protein